MEFGGVGECTGAGQVPSGCHRDCRLTLSGPRLRRMPQRRCAVTWQAPREVAIVVSRSAEPTWTARKGLSKRARSFAQRATFHRRPSTTPAGETNALHSLDPPSPTGVRGISNDCRSPLDCQRKTGRLYAVPFLCCLFPACCAATSRGGGPRSSHRTHPSWARSHCRTSRRSRLLQSSKQA